MTTRLTILTEIIAPYRIPIFNALAKVDGINLHVIFLAETDPEARDWLVYKNEIHFSSQVLPSYRKRLGRHNLLLNLGVGRALRRAKPDVIICGGYNYIASWRALSWARRNRVPFLLWTESNSKDLRQNNLLTQRLKRTFIGKCNGFVVPGKASREYLLSFNVSPEKTFTAPNAVDNNLYKNFADDVRRDGAKWRSQLNLPKRYFLFVGRMVVEKGIFDLLRAYDSLDPKLRADVGLVFVGDGSARAELERLSRTVKTGQIQFAGFIQRENLPRYYALAEALVLPTHTDTWGLVVNEAMACSLPIVCTDVAGCVPDLVEEGWNGRVIPARNIKALARILKDLASNTEIVREMGENSGERILHFSPEIFAQGIAEAAFSARVKL
ncbi:MAG: glycosyltransferase family 4 protein [Terriglobales bacterium]